MDDSKDLTEEEIRFLEQRRRVVQLLKDQNHAYSTERSCNPFPKGGSPDIPPEEVSDGYWNLTPEAERRRRKAAQGDPYAITHEIIAAELRFMKEFSIFFYAAQAVFLEETANDRAYEDLKAKAQADEAALVPNLRKATERMHKDEHKVRAYCDVRTEAMKLWQDVNIFIDALTTRLLSYNLHVVFPEKFDRMYADDLSEEATKTNRTLGMEEKYREIHAVFERWCEELSQKHARFRNKAFNNTVITTGQPRSTVERAVHYVESAKKEKA